LETERDALKDELLQLTAIYDVELKELKNQKKDHDMKVKLVEKEKDDVRKELDALKEQLSKITADYNSKVEQLRQQKEDIIRELNKQIADHKLQVSQLEMQRDHVTDEMSNQEKDPDMKVKLLEKEICDVKKEHDVLKKQLKKLQQENTELNETINKPVKQLKNPKKSVLGRMFAKKGKLDDVIILPWR